MAEPQKVAKGWPFEVRLWLTITDIGDPWAAELIYDKEVGLGLTGSGKTPEEACAALYTMAKIRAETHDG